MPKLKKPVLETDTLVTRAIAIPLIQEIMRYRMGIPSNTPITFPGTSETVSQAGGLISNKNEQARLPTTTKLSIVVTESPVTDWMPSAQTTAGEQVPIFLNKDLELVMHPIYFSVEMRISIHYRAENKTDARQFYNYMMMKIPDREDTWLHEIKYSFGIPQIYNDILREIHAMTEKVEGYGDSYEDFFLKWAHPRWGQLTDQAGKNTTDVVSETQARCMGYFDLPPEPDWGARGSENDSWDMEFPYVLRYEKISDIFFSYPIVIHNQIISKKYRNDSGMKLLKDQQTHRSWSMHHLKHFESMENIPQRDREPPGRYFPTYDEFTPRNPPEKTKRVFTCLVQLPKEDTPGPVLLMNLNDVAELGQNLAESIKTFASTEAPWITRPRYSALNVALYIGRLCMDGNYIKVDSDLNVWAIKPLSRRKYYHIRFSVVEDLSYLVPEAKDRLKLNPPALANIVEYVLPEGTVVPVPQVNHGQVTNESYDQLEEITKTGPKAFGRGMKTVQTTRIGAVYSSTK